MKFYLIALLFCLKAFSQNYSIAEPRLRVNRTTSLPLTTGALGVALDWQTIDFNGASSFNTNTFGAVDMEGNRMVSWDSTNKLFKFKGDYDRNYSTTLFLTTSTNLVTTRASIQVRFVVPNGVSPGVDLYLPFPDDPMPYADAGEVTLLANGVRHLPLPLDIYSNSAIRANGIKVQVRLSNNLVAVGACNVTSASYLIQD